ncbi:MAG: HypC/HybG/HupF family hydrogenase formation chaperone [Planctomycetes bacterium]|nr:HypC/HybG/HupF family hydrogenase formation chaperone [Planctomycetota bacterium]
MCLAIPGRVVRWIERESPFCEAEIQFFEVYRKCNMSCVPEAEEGDYVIVHAGVAISKVDTAIAEQLLIEISSSDVWDELHGSEA